MLSVYIFPEMKIIHIFCLPHLIDILLLSNCWEFILLGNKKKFLRKKFWQIFYSDQNIEYSLAEIWNLGQNRFTINEKLNLTTFDIYAGVDPSKQNSQHFTSRLTSYLYSRFVPNSRWLQLFVIPLKWNCIMSIEHDQKATL